MIDEDKTSDEDEEEEEEQEPELSKEEYIERAKKNFDLILRVRMNGPYKMEKAICDHFGVKIGSLHTDSLEKIAKVCKAGDTSRGSTYIDHGLLYGSSLYRAESGHYVASYKFMCKA